MQCPVCTTATLTPHELETHLTSHQCPACGGQWISGERYRTWHAQHNPSALETPLGDAPLPVTESDKPKRCPDCAHLLLPHSVGHGLTFVLDHCGYCGGTWFDKNEWEALKSHGLVNDLQAIFTSVWQSDLRRTARLQASEARHIEKFGAQEWAEVRRIKSWIDAHPYKTEIHAYLLHSEGDETDASTIIDRQSVRPTNYDFTKEQCLM